MTSASAETAAVSLGIVVISRDEARHIRACLEALLRAVRDLPQAEIVLVDSGSSDATVEIAAEHPVSVYRYAGPLFTAAAGRRIGAGLLTSDLVLFVDGDCVLETSWLPEALELLQRDESIAVVYGRRREVHPEPRAGVVGVGVGAGPASEEYGLGGNALYRKSVLDAVGGFHPFLAAEEEAELLGRIGADGYRAVDTGTVMFAHHTEPKDSLREFWRRGRSGLLGGPGPVLRVALGQGRLVHHARRYNRYLATLAYLALGPFAAAMSLAGRPGALGLWAASGALAFGALALRRGSLRGAAYVATDWLLVAMRLPAGFARAVPDPARFAPQVECLKQRSQIRS